MPELPDAPSPIYHGVVREKQRIVCSVVDAAHDATGPHMYIVVKLLDRSLELGERGLRHRLVPSVAVGQRCDEWWSSGGRHTGLSSLSRSGVLGPIYSDLARDKRVGFAIGLRFGERRWDA